MCSAINQLLTIAGWGCFAFSLMYILDENIGFAMFFFTLGSIFWLVSK